MLLILESFLVAINLLFPSFNNLIFFSKKFHVIDYNGSAYTKSSSPIDVFTASGAPWDTGSIRTDDASGTFGTVNLISFFAYGGSNDGKTFIAGIDAGDSTIS